MPLSPPLIAPSLLSADFSRLKEEVQALELALADLLHLDVMDGLFVPNLTFGPLLISAIRQHTSLPLDAHLMILEPSRYLEDFAKAGADWICVHAEAEVHLHRTVMKIKELGKKAGVSLNPHTPLQVIDYLLEDLDYVLIMTVNPGFGGQKFIPQVLKKIKDLREMIDVKGLKTLIQVDGGINRETVKDVISAGADIIIAGTAILKEKDYKAAIETLRYAK